MAIEVQLRRGTSTQNASFTGIVGELVYTTDTKDLYVHDGSTPGGTLVGGGAASIADGSITYAKIQDVAGNNVFLGNDNGVNSDVQELTATDAGTTFKIDDSAVTTAKINNGAVTADKLSTTIDLGTIV